MNYVIEKFMSLALLLSLVLSMIFMLPIGFILHLLGLPILMIILAGLLLFVGVFWIVMHLPAYNIKRLGRKMESEVAVTGRRLLIQIESGRSLVNSLINLGTRYKRGSSKSLELIAQELYMGKPLEETIDSSITNSPSRTFKKVFIQIRNALKTGADLKHTLKTTLEEITRSKIVEFETFSNKLNPLGLFYMIFGTIVPSLGIIAFVVVLAVLRIKVTFTVMGFFLLLVLIIQLTFMMIFTSIRPRLEL